jgi:hypothetical protein
MNNDLVCELITTRCLDVSLDLSCMYLMRYRSQILCQERCKSQAKSWERGHTQRADRGWLAGSGSGARSEPARRLDARRKSVCKSPMRGSLVRWGPGTTPCLPLWLPACAMVATASVHTGTIAQTQKRGWSWAECYSILILLGQWYYGFKIPSVFLKIIGGLNFVNRPVSTKSDRLVDKSTENQEEKPESTVVL